MDMVSVASNEGAAHVCSRQRVAKVDGGRFQAAASCPLDANSRYVVHISKANNASPRGLHALESS